MFPYMKDPQGRKDMGNVPGIEQSGDCSDGFGKMQFAEGNVYEGNWQDDEMEGIGTYTFASDGASWEGPWRDGQRGGVGTWRFPDGLVVGRAEGPDENDLWGTVAPAKWRSAAEAATAAAAAAAAAVAASREGEAKEEESRTDETALFVNGEKHASLTAEFGCQDFTVQSTPMTTVTPANASTPIEEDLAGKVAVIDRGEVTFVHKAKAAQDKGAIAVIIVNSDEELRGLAQSPGFKEISIYVCCVSKSTGDALKALGQDGLVTFTRRTKREVNPINCLAAMGIGVDDAERAALLAKHDGDVEVAVAAFFG